MLGLLSYALPRPFLWGNSVMYEPASPFLFLDRPITRLFYIAISLVCTGLIFIFHKKRTASDDGLPLEPDLPNQK
jgi:hypothetical protein